jgi:DNA repair protein RecN (Recombination protein N)
MDSIGLMETKKEELLGKISAVRKEYAQVSADLSKKRRAASKKLERTVETELKSLAMPHARFSIEWADVMPGRAAGIDRPSLLISANPGEAPWPVEKIASGGELSRVMLALRTVLAVDGSQKSLVFDEIDAGIGGKAAETVGQKLKELSSRYQIFCVTHLAQIAAFADHQYRIEKLVQDGRSITRVEPLSGEDRIDELVRMMSGSRATDAARRHVRELLANLR